MTDHTPCAESHIEANDLCLQFTFNVGGVVDF